MKKTMISKLPFMVLVIASLASGIFTGWFRLGFELPVSSVFLHHGAMMTGSFLGTVILIERIMALKQRWLFSFPFINASSLVFYYLEFDTAAFACLIFGSIGLFYVFFLINQQYADLPHQVMWVGSAAWFVGNVHLLIFRLYAHSILWWMAFLLLTIVGERLELSRFLPVSKFKQRLLVFFLALFLISCVLPFHLGGQILTGITLLLIAIWLLLYDMVRKSIRKPGIHKFSAFTLICGYGWLALSGLLYMLDNTGLITYDALIHSFFLGFVFSMIFAHAPIILPGVLGLGFKPYHPTLYVWVVLFQLSLIVRIVGGLLSLNLWKQYGGLVNGVVILLFLFNVMIVVITRWGSSEKPSLQY
ncbi:MAG: hypothetical protein ABJ004_13955 [Cyclobacteriaceae bacterium]